jgi:glycosyltransferase involved in cell wall biosynthesis
MKKILYITDQEEYSENGTISSLFDIYLKEYFDIDIVYMTKYKFSFSKKGNHLIVPLSKQKHIIEYLTRRDIDISSYDFVFVRNKKTVLENVLRFKSKYNYKIIYRVSYPIKHHKLEYIDSFFPYSLVKKYQYKKKINKRDTLVNKCDLFSPASMEVKNEFYSNINIETFPIFTGLDPNNLNEHILSNDKNIKKFIYVGSIDSVRQFDVILDAFSKLKDTNWQLTISTTKKMFIIDLLKHYSHIRNNINLISAMSLKELRDQINQHDIGIALMPRNRFYDTVLSDKVIDYSSCSLPSLLTKNNKNSAIFDNDEAYFSEFNTNDIANKLEDIINFTHDDISLVGNKAQKKLLSIKRNYKILAKELSEKLLSL